VCEKVLTNSTKIERERANRRASKCEPIGGRASVKAFWRAPASARECG